jgi:hypothetical protein
VPSGAAACRQLDVVNALGPDIPHESGEVPYETEGHDGTMRIVRGTENRRSVSGEISKF